MKCHMNAPEAQGCHHWLPRTPEAGKDSNPLIMFDHQIWQSMACSISSMRSTTVMLSLILKGFAWKKHPTASCNKSKLKPTLAFSKLWKLKWFVKFPFGPQSVCGHNDATKLQTLTPWNQTQNRQEPRKTGRNCCGCCDSWWPYNRRKFRSQTSDNMDRWKAEVGRVREGKSRREKIREEKESEERRCRCAKR